MIVYALTPKKLKNKSLLVLSLIFYSWGEPAYLLLLLLSILVTWFGVRHIHRIRTSREEAKFYMVCLIVFNIAILGFFKYYGFLIDNFNFITRLNLKIIDLPLPFGISFYTFKIISYIVDVYTARTRPQKSLADFALYISIFPQAGAGPIVQYSEMEGQLKSRTNDIDHFGRGVEKFIIGLGKKVLIANNMALIWASVKGIPGLEMSAMTAWLGIIAYTLQIYFDFSGYSDMAIGLGYMMGFEWAENFNYPYVAKSATEFWRRWHISLGNWFKTYIYFPLGGNRCSKLINMRNIFVVWMVTGLWHGANWNFVLWGLFYGLLIYFEKLSLGRRLAKTNKKIQSLYCLLIVVMGWVLFDFTSLSEIFKFYSNMFIFGSTGLVDKEGLHIIKTSWKLMLPAIIGSTPFVMKVINNIKSRFGKRGYIGMSVFYIVVLYLSVASLVGDSFSPFLYFKF